MYIAASKALRMITETFLQINPVITHPVLPKKPVRTLTGYQFNELNTTHKIINAVADHSVTVDQSYL